MVDPIVKRTGFGFGAELVNVPAAEAKLNIEITENPSKGAYQLYLGRFVKMDTSRGYTYFGVYRGVNVDGAHVLRPSIFLEDILSPKKRLNERQEWKDESGFIHGDIEYAQFADEKILNNVAKNFESVRGLGKIVLS